jgi:hypothetical protein
VDGVGTKITHCRIHDIPSSAMRINGNDHIVEYNELFQVVTESDDQGAIDMWGDPTFRGNTFRYNYIHDVGPYDKDEVNAHCGRAGIRLDDAISGNLIEAHIFENCSGGLFGAIQIHGGKENLIRRNLIYHCTAGISFTPWSEDKWINYTKRWVDFFKENRDTYSERYPELLRLNQDLNRNTIVQNIFLQCDQTTLRRPEVIIFKDNIETNDKRGIFNPGSDDLSVENTTDIIKNVLKIME